MALGVAFGLMCSLGLKHSNLALYPRIESCIVALVAYTSYFFSNGCSMSGEYEHGHCCAAEKGAERQSN